MTLRYQMLFLIAALSKIIAVASSLSGGVPIGVDNSGTSVYRFSLSQNFKNM